MSRKAKLISVLAAALALIFLAVAYIAGRGRIVGDLFPSPSPSPPPRAAFQLGEIRAVDSLDRPEAVAKANESAAEIIVLLNAYYDTAFVDVDKWAAGSHPGLASQFTSESQPTVGPAANLGSLALAELAPRVRSVKPTRQEASKISFLFDADLTAPSAIVTAIFEADATTRDGRAGPVKIVHQATFWVTREAASYRIMAYAVELRADTVPRSAAFGKIPELVH